MPEPKSASVSCFACASGEASSAWANTSTNLLICFHLRAIDGTTWRCAVVTPSAVRKGRPMSTQRCFSRSCARSRPSVATPDWRRPRAACTGLLADRQLPFVLARVQVGVAKPPARATRPARPAPGRREVAREVARLVGVDKRQRRLTRAAAPAGRSQRSSSSGARCGLASSRRTNAAVAQAGLGVRQKRCTAGSASRKRGSLQGRG